MCCRRSVVLTPRSRRSGSHGIAAPLFAILLVALLGLTGLVVDLGSWQVEASSIQQATDAAALAGVVKLPDGDSSAITTALDVAARNGYVDGEDGVSVTAVALSDDSMEVTIERDGVKQYFTGLFVDPGTISRTSTARYVQPVALGSPTNYLGTGDLLDGLVDADNVENFWLAVSGRCTRREYGDRVTPIAMAIPGSGPYSCEPDVAPRRPNPEYSADGYFFGVDVPEANGASPVHIQMFDAPVCAGGNSGAGDEQKAPFDVEVTVRVGNNLSPGDSTVMQSQTFHGSSGTGGDCGTGPFGGECTSGSALAGCWTTLATVYSPGTYYVQVAPLGDDTNVDSRHDQFSLRAKAGVVFSPCTSDVSIPWGTQPAYDPGCSQVYGIEHLPVFANIPGDDPIFHLASVNDAHNGKTMYVTLYDAAEGGSGIRILDPNGDEATFTWEVLCADGSVPTSSCPGEQEPTGGRSGGPTQVLDVAGTGTKTFAENTQNGKYSDRLVRLAIQLPDDIAAAYGNATWWRIKYDGNFSGDRTTWSVRILGDAVRLTPNAGV